MRARGANTTTTITSPRSAYHSHYDWESWTDDYHYGTANSSNSGGTGHKLLERDDSASGKTKAIPTRPTQILLIFLAGFIILFLTVMSYHAITPAVTVSRT